MPTNESEAIVLQCYPLGESDRLVSFLSRSHGRLRGVASGARRPKSRFGSTLERLSHIRIWFFEREGRDLVRINQCEIIESFMDAFRDYDSSVVLALLSEVTENVLPDRESSDANFRLLLLTTKRIKESGKCAIPLAYFALWTVKLGGWLPTLDICNRCHKPLLRSEPAFFSPAALAILCGKCCRAGMRAVSADAFEAARRILAEHIEKLNEEAISSRSAREISEVMLDIIEHQIDRKLMSRDLMESIA